MELHALHKGQLYCVMASNHAIKYGGAIHCDFCGMMVLWNVMFDGNVASKGGGVFSNSNRSTSSTSNGALVIAANISLFSAEFESIGDDHNNGVLDIDSVSGGIYTEAT